MHAQPSAVSALALEAGLPLERPERLRDPDFLAVLAAWQPDIAAVVAFRMLPEVVFRLPQWGTINLCLAPASTPGRCAHPAGHPARTRGHRCDHVLP